MRTGAGPPVLTGCRSVRFALIMVPAARTFFNPKNINKYVNMLFDNTGCREGKPPGPCRCIRRQDVYIMSDFATPCVPLTGCGPHQRIDGPGHSCPPFHHRPRPPWRGRVPVRSR